MNRNEQNSSESRNSSFPKLLEKNVFPISVDGKTN